MSSFEQPAKSCTVLVTRPEGNQAQALSEELSKHGFAVIKMPLLRIEAPDSWLRFDQSFSDLLSYDWIVFASRNAVETSLNRARETGVFDALRKIRIAVIGSSTKAALESHGLKASFCPSSYIAESFAAEFPKADSTDKKERVLWPKTDKGRMLVKEELEKLGYLVDTVISYKSRGPHDPLKCALELAGLLQEQKLDIVTLNSSETARHFKQVIELACLHSGLAESELLHKFKIAAIGPETGKTCISLFGRLDIEASPYTSAGLVQAIKKATTDSCS